MIKEAPDTNFAIGLDRRINRSIGGIAGDLRERRITIVNPFCAVGERDRSIARRMGPSGAASAFRISAAAGADIAGSVESINSGA